MRRFFPVMYKTSWLIFFSFLILAVLDFYSTFSGGDLIQYLEANPIYLMGFGFWPIIFLNMVALFCLLKSYDNWHKPDVQFITLSTYIWFSVLRIIVIINNFSVVESINNGEITKEVAMAVTTTSKVNGYVYIYLFTLVAPLLITWLIYLIFRWEHSIKQKNE